jgi:hypothetical protein
VPSFIITAFDHQLLKPGSLQLGVGTVLADEEIGGAPYVEI